MSEAIINQITQTGVLGAVLVWFMLRMEGLMKENTKVLMDLRDLIKEMKKV